MSDDVFREVWERFRQEKDEQAMQPSAPPASQFTEADAIHAHGLGVNLQAKGA